MERLGKKGGNTRTTWDVPRFPERRTKTADLEDKWNDYLKHANTDQKMRRSLF